MKTIEEIKAAANGLASSSPEMATVRRVKPMPSNATRADVVALLRWLEGAESHRMSGTARIAIDNMLTRLQD